MEKIEKFFKIYYLIAFLYLSVAIILSFAGLKLENLGSKWFKAKITIIFLLFLLLLRIFLPFFVVYILIPFIFCAAAFIYVDKREHTADGKFTYYTNERWEGVIKIGKNWFFYGSIAVLAAIIFAIIQVQVFQGGRDGLFVEYKRCIEWSYDRTTCLLEAPIPQTVGTRLAKLMILYSGQAFIWTGLFFVIKKDGKRILKRFSYPSEINKINISEKIEKFKKDHYI